MESFAAILFREVADYLRSPGVRESIQDTLAKLIRARRAEVVLAHSLAYETLWRHSDLPVG